MSNKIDFKLDPATHDLIYENKDLTFVSGIDFYRQKIAIVLQFFFGEWFLNTTLGIKFFEVILIKNPDQTLIDNLIKTEILNADVGILQITEYDSFFDKTNRKFTITASVFTDAGTFTINDNFNIGV